MFASYYVIVIEVALNTQELFFELIQIALGNRACLSKTPTEKEWYALYELAEKHAIVGICFAGVERLKNHQQLPPVDLLMDWLGQTEYIKTQNEFVNADCETTKELFREKGYWTCIIKGQQVARRYKVPANSPEGEELDLSMMRTSGDIDIWVIPKEMVEKEKKEGLIGRARRETIRRVLKEYPDSVFWLHHINYPNIGQTSVEVHFTPSTVFNLIENKRVQRFFEDNIGRSEDELPADVDVVFQLMHMRKHLVSEGIGLRQVIDYYMTCKALMAESHRNSCSGGRNGTVSKSDLWPKKNVEVKQRIKELGLESFAKAINWVLAFGLGLCDQGLGAPWLICEPDEKRGRFVLAAIMKGGNFGKHDPSLGSMGESRLAHTWFFTKLAMRTVKYFPSESIWNPIYRVYVAVWKRLIK